MKMKIVTHTRKDNEGCIIATAASKQAKCIYDGDQYTGDGATDEDLRYAARIAWEHRFQHRPAPLPV